MQDIAGQRGSSQAATAGGVAVEAEVGIDDDIIARDPKVAGRPTKPTRAMIQAHGLHHADYRDWCDNCRAGKGVSHQHRSSENDSEEAEPSVDYALMTKEGLAKMEKYMREPEKLGATPILIGCAHQSKAIWAMAVNMKGPTDSAVDWLTGKIDQVGCRGVKVQAESIIALKKVVAIKRQAPTLNIESPVRDSPANGNAERAVRTWAAQLRTMRHHMEFRMQHKIPIHAALVTWLVSWAADVICLY